MSGNPGIYPALVIDNIDPQRASRVRIRLAHLYGEQSEVWASPCLPFGTKPGQASLPPIGTKVWVALAHGGTAVVLGYSPAST